MTLVLMAGWVRSISAVDVIILRGMSVQYFFVSGGQEFQIVSGSSANLHCGADGEYDVKLIVFRGIPPLARRWFGRMVENEPFRRVGIFLARDNDLPFIEMVPYWLIVCPLTLISACLLLFKPSKSNKRQTGEPLPADGT